MAFTFVLLAAATLAAFCEASPRYGSGVLSSAVGLHREPLIRSGGVYSKYDAGRLLNDYAYNPRRGNIGVGRVRGVGVGDISHIPHSHVCNCQLGEVCKETVGGRSYCESASGVGRVSDVRVGHGIHSHGHVHDHGSLVRPGLGVSNACAYLEYPNDCVRSASLGRRYTITRYTSSHGRCQPFTSSRVSRFCRPRGQYNNIFSSRFECEQYCLY